MDDYYALLRELYETERKLPERNFAKDHSFEERVTYRQIVVEGC